MRYILIRFNQLYMRLVKSTSTLIFHKLSLFSTYFQWNATHLMSFLLCQIIAGLLNIHLNVKRDIFKNKGSLQGWNATVINLNHSVILYSSWILLHKLLPPPPKRFKCLPWSHISWRCLWCFPKVRNSELKYFSFSSAHRTNPRF